MTDDLVERVARAICRSDAENPFCVCESEGLKATCKSYLTQATAAIAVMFDATKEFLDEVEKLDKSVWGDKDTREVAMALWRDDMALWKDDE